MPGIIGVISNKPQAECESNVQAMGAVLFHEESYEFGTHSEFSLGVYLGWTQHSGEVRIASDDRDSIILLMAGELFDEAPVRSGHGSSRYSDTSSNATIIRAYQMRGEKFLPELNGLFSGVLVDRLNRQVHLFNDRYCAERLYVYEAKDAVYFASEAKAILSVVPEARAFDEEGLTQHLAFGCTIGEHSLFRDVRILPGASHWTFHRGTCTKRTYFSPSHWEQQPRLSPSSFEPALAAVLSRIVPSYGRADTTIGISLTAGLDTRMVMASLAPPLENFVAFTYSGEDIDPLDARIAAEIAASAGMKHHLLRIGADFFRDFASLADQTVYITDGCFNMFGAHEIYMSRMARKLAPLRLTGNYGSEILRGVSTLKPAHAVASLLNPELSRAFHAVTQHSTLRNTHPVTFAAFKEVPWNLYGNLSAGRSQLRMRTPYLDNAFVELAYRCPASPRVSRDVCCNVVRRCRPGMAVVPTDMGFLGSATGLPRFLRHAWGRITFKLDYMDSEGLPNLLAPIEPVFQRTMNRLGLLGLHKHLRYRSWTQTRLAGFVNERLTDPALRQSSIWDHRIVQRLAHEHISREKNRVLEIDAVLTLQSIEHQLIRGIGLIRHSPRARMPVSLAAQIKRA